MRGIDQHWEATTDPAEREAMAHEQHEQAVALLQSDTWRQLSHALTEQIGDTLKDLARSSDDDERNRGVIRALEHVQSMPENLIQAASAELDKHR